MLSSNNYSFRILECEHCFLVIHDNIFVLRKCLIKSLEPKWLLNGITCGERDRDTGEMSVGKSRQVSHGRLTSGDNHEL